jgi:hypothetical protein
MTAADPMDGGKQVGQRFWFVLAFLHVDQYVSIAVDVGRRGVMPVLKLSLFVYIAVKRSDFAQEASQATLRRERKLQ